MGPENLKRHQKDSYTNVVRRHDFIIAIAKMQARASRDEEWEWKPSRL